MAMAAEKGVFAATPRSPELLSVVRRYGDEAMDFIWKNKGALTVAAVLATFLKDPEAYFSGMKDLVVEPLVAPIVRSVNWTWIVVALLAVVFLPVTLRTLTRAKGRPGTVASVKQRLTTQTHRRP